MSEKNVAHSIFQRLLKRARTKREDFNLLLSRYGMERFLYRLSSLHRFAPKHPLNLLNQFLREFRKIKHLDAWGAFCYHNKSQRLDLAWPMARKIMNMVW